MCLAAKSSTLTQSELERVQLCLKSEFRMGDPEMEQYGLRAAPQPWMRSDSAGKQKKTKLKMSPNWMIVMFSFQGTI